jgi:hypothetical protein
LFRVVASNVPWCRRRCNPFRGLKQDAFDRQSLVRENAPASGLSTIVEVIGALRFASGQLSKLVASHISVTTPVAPIGVRGTEFFAGPIDDRALGVFLIDGAVSVSNAAGQRILNRPGQGTNIATAGVAPGPVTVWPPAKVNRALAAVTFQ